MHQGNNIDVLGLAYLLCMCMLSEAHVCILQQRFDPMSRIIRWSLPRQERCLCQGVVVPQTASSKPCQRTANTATGAADLWFTDFQFALSNHRNWNPATLDNLLDRQDCYNNECLSNQCQHDSQCYDRYNNYVCVCSKGFNGSDCENDIEAPKIYCPTNQTLETSLNFAFGFAVWGNPQVIDNSKQTPSISCSSLSGSWFAIGQTDVICKVHDRAWNAATCTFTIEITDVEEPTIACPSDRMTVTDPSQPTAIVAWNDPEVTDNSGQDISIACKMHSESHFEIGQTEVTCKAVDASGNSATCKFTVDVADTEDPIILCPENQVIEAAPNVFFAVAIWSDPQATDNSGISLDVTCNLESESKFEIGQTQVEFKAHDPSANEASCSFTINVAATCFPVCANDGTCEAPGKCSCTQCYQGPLCASVLSGVSGPLGLRHGTINDNQITASSEYSGTKVAREGRLHNSLFWAARVGEASPWLQVDFIKLVVITGMQTQGAGRIAQWAKVVQVKYGKTLNDLQTISKNFPANVNKDDVKHIEFPSYYEARYVRVIVLTFEWHPAMRMEVLGYICG